MAHQHLHGLDFRVLRVANPFGPFQVAAKNQGIVAALIAHALAGEPAEIWGDGSVVRDYIFVADVIDALQAAAADRSEARVFNIGSGRGRSLREIIAALEAKLGRKIKINWKPGRPIDVPTSVLSIDRARTLLGWAPKTRFEAGLEQTIAWWRERTKRRRPSPQFGVQGRLLPRATPNALLPGPNREGSAQENEHHPTASHLPKIRQQRRFGPRPVIAVGVSQCAETTQKLAASAASPTDFCC